MSEDGNPVCTYSGANSCKKFGFVTTSIELNEHDFLSHMHSENAMKTSSNSTGLPLKSKSVKAWQTEVWKWSLLYNEKPIVDVSTQLTTLHDDQNKVETFWFWKVLLHDCSMWPLLNLTVSKMSDFGFFAGFATWMWKQACKMRKWQGQTLSMSEEWILVCTHSYANSCKEVRVCDYECWIKWAWLFKPAQTKTEGSSGYIVPNLMPGSMDISVCSRIATNKTPRS